MFLAHLVSLSFTFLLWVKYYLLEPACITIYELGHAAVNRTRLRFGHLRDVTTEHRGGRKGPHDSHGAKGQLHPVPSAELASILAAPSTSQESKTHLRGSDCLRPTNIFELGKKIADSSLLFSCFLLMPVLLVVCMWFK